METDNKTLLKDIAKTTNYSISTISRALTGKGYIKRDKKSVIIQEAKKKGYFKNILSNIPIFSKILIFVPCEIFSEQTRIIATFYIDLIEFIREEASRLNIEIELGLLEDSKPLKKFMKYTITSDTDAIIAIGFDKTELDMLNKVSTIPTILINSQIYSSNFNSISPDNRAIGYQCTEHLIENGHTNILHIANSDRKTIHDREIGFKDALMDHNIKFDSNNVLRVYNETNYLDNKILNGKLIDMIKEKNITAIFVSIDVIAIALLKVLKNHNISVPDDVSLIGVDNDKISQYSYPPLTTYELPKKEIAIHAIQSLIYQQILLEKTHLKVQLYGQLIERKSVKNLKNDDDL